MFRTQASRALARRVLGTIRAHDMIREGDPLVVGVSGGLDSSSCLAILRSIESELPHRRIVAHVNYRLRGEESDADERFVSELARAGGEDLRVLRVEPVDWPRGQSRQAAARAIRYAFFRRVAEEAGGWRIAVAHTEDDLVETVLMRLLAGSTPGGAVGIRAALGDIVRPLIETSRASLERLAGDEEISFREDRSNRERAYLRNRVRADLLPALEVFNPAVRSALVRFARAASRDEEVLRAAGSELRRKALLPDGGAGEVRLDLGTLSRAEDALVTRVLFRALSDAAGPRARPSAAHVESLLGLIRRPREGTELTLPSGLRAEVRDGIVALGHEARSRPTSFTYGLAVPGAASIPEIGLRVEASIGRAVPAGSDPAVASLAADLAAGGLVVRNLRPGDRFRPEGMGGHSRKVADFLSDRKVPRLARGRVPLVAAADGRIVWLVGYRLAEGARSPLGSLQAVVVRFSSIERDPP